MSKRALRRHHKQRMIKKAMESSICDFDPQRARKLADHLRVCSCNLCGNPRRTGWNQGQNSWTIQEYKSFLGFQEMLQEADSPEIALD